MCDICGEVLELLTTYDPEVCWGSKKRLKKTEIATICNYVQSWCQRQCMCVYRETCNYDRFNHLIQGVLWAVLELLRTMELGIPPAPTVFVHVAEPDVPTAIPKEQPLSKEGIENDANNRSVEKMASSAAIDSQSSAGCAARSPSKETVDDSLSALSTVVSAVAAHDEITDWTLEEKEHLLQFATKAFLLNFPHYTAYKHNVHAKLEDISQQEATVLSVHCDTNDPEIPIHLLRNVCFFCDHDALHAMTACFIDAAPDTLPFCLARAMISIVSNLKLWLNVAAVVKYLVPLRTAVIRYMCKLSDKDLRAAGTRSMSEFMWTAVKDPLDSHLSFDREGLDLAFKYFTSSTLTMRLAGLAHINNHVTMYNELCSSDAVVETEALGIGLADWLINSRVIENIFGPNLHVEIIKQSHVVLNFLAMEGCITNEHVEGMWTAAQLKHCSKQVHDLLLPLIKHLEPRPVVHLYQLLGRLEAHDHSEQTLYLASALLKVIWSNGNIQHPTQLTLGCDQSQLHHRLSPFTAVLKGAVSELANAVEAKEGRHDSSTEHSVSLDSDDTQENNPAVLGHQHLRQSSDGRPVEQNKTSNMSNIALLQEWANEEASFTSSDNDSDNITDIRRRRSSPAGRVPGVQELPLVVSVAALSSDSDERGSVEESAPSDDDDDDDGDCAMVPCRRKKSVRERQKKRRILLHDTSWQKESEEVVGLTTRPVEGEGRQTPAPRVEPKSSEKESDSAPAKRRRESSPSPHEPAATKEATKNSEGTDGKVNAPVLQTTIIEDHEDCEESEDREQSQLSEEKVFECMQYLEQQMQSERLSHPHVDLMEDIMSADEATCSSRLSNKSDKNMEDFEGEESGCDAELIQLTSHGGHMATTAATTVTTSPHYHVRQHLANMASMCCTHFHRPGSQRSMQHGNAMEILRFDMESVCQPGQTLLWDLLQDESVVKLGKGLALEAEKVLSNLVCWSTDRIIRMKFIEGCLQNLSNNKSIYLSLRLLPRLFGSFQQYRGRMDTHTITMWAEKEHHMMEHFFNNLMNYTRQIRQGNTSSVLYSHQVEIQVRLQFLTCIFSAAGSPDYFRLSVEQVDTLWWCLASDVESADELFNWFLIQTKSKDEHALGMDALFHIFTEKLPLMQPETTSMTALNLLQQLGTIVRHADDAALDPSTARVGAPRGMDQLWGIALRAHSTDVSMAAIQYLNSYYVGGHLQSLEREEEFIQRCMTSLASVLPLLEKCDESSLVVVQRALLLLKTHLETFHRRYAYHLRTWHLEGRGILSHQRPPADQLVAPLRVICQPAGITEKIILELLTTDFVADLRADVTHWWEQFQQKHRSGLRSRHQELEISPDVSSASSSSSSMSSSSSTSSSGSSSGGAEAVAADAAGSTADGSTNTTNVMSSAQSPPTVVSPILGAMLTDGPIRVITQGQELTTDFDERTLGELGFKDMQLVFVSVGAPRPHRKRDDLQQEPASSLPPPPREKLPASLLLQTSYFEQLFRLIQQLSQLKAVGRRGNSVPHTKAQLLSWRVWEILMMLPTCPETMKSLRSLGSTDTCDSSAGVSYQEVMRMFLDPQSPHKLMYSLQIVETLMPPMWKSRSLGPHNVTAEIQGISVVRDCDWAKQFVEKGGLRHLFDIFMSGILQPQDKAVWSEWHQDCLAYLLKLIYQLGLDNPMGIEGGACDNVKALSVSCDGSFTNQGGTSGNNSLVKRKSKKQKRVHPERIALPKLNQVMLTMLSDVPTVMKRIVSILYDAGRLHDNECFKLGGRGRGQVVHYTLSFFLSWLLSRDEVFVVLFGDPHMTGWLRHLLLDDPEPSVRQEICSSLYRLCMGMSSDGHSGQVFVAPLLNCFLGFLHCAQNMKSPRMEMMLESEKDKEPYGPACRDYFWLVCRLVESLNEDSLKDSQDYKSLFDLDGMATKLAEAILDREFLETRHNTVEDDGLVGLFNLCTVVIKHNPPFKFGKDGQEFLLRIFDCLFALPSPKQRHLPLCKSQASRSAAYDLVIELTKGCFDNYAVLHQRLMQQHSPNSHSSYPWDYWPHEDGRSDCGYVGLTNLGATCYMASCMQHLYMMPQARASILSAKCSLDGKHESMLWELQRMFAYLLESERKAYNPRSFCKVYTMDHQPLNTGEQKDMAEFFTDLISKLEEMTPQLKELVKTLFQGVITNNVVSLDCLHVSRTLEECYTVRCQVADMRNLYESLDEVTVKDTLEGDNMYTCSQCGHKVRAEKRACFKKLPRILCFNTMRYTFNMVTMMKEKVNTHFSFPLRLDMSKYTEKHLMPDQYRADGEIKDGDTVEGDEYDLIGVTVHTGTADGGHYYSFIRDRLTLNKDKWFLFNDAEVKPFDSAQLAAECFGGEMTSKTYDSVTDKFMDFSFEKTNSAYMLFYERVNFMSRPNSTMEASVAVNCAQSSPVSDSVATNTITEPVAFVSAGPTSVATASTTEPPVLLQTIELPKDLADWIWEDNMQFLQDRNIFEHTYFNFMWQVCGYVPQTLMQHRDVTLLAAKLSTSFVLETLIHAKEKPTMVQWIELLTKLFNSSQNACEWFLNHMAEHEWWPVQILIRCPNQVVRQMFQRLCIHVINKLRPVLPQRIIPLSNDERENSNDGEIIPCCVTRFVGKLLSLIEHGANQHTKHLTEYFAFLVEFAKMSCRESQFLLSIEAISTVVNFYLGHKAGDYVDPVSDEDEEETDDVLSLADDKCKPVSLEKMVALVAMLVEKSRGDDHHLHLSESDLSAVAGGKGFPFLCQQIRDNINIRQTCNLIFSLCRWNEQLAIHIVAMVYQAISQHPDQSQPFYKLMSMLVEIPGGPPGLPAFTKLVLQHIWDVADNCPQQCLEWLSIQVPRNKLAHSWVLQRMEHWVEVFLIAHSNQRVRNAAAFLLVSLIPSSHFKQAFRTARNMLCPQKEIPMSPDALIVLHHIYDLLLRLLKRAKHYVDTGIHGTTKLTSYFALMTYCLVSHTEKLMFGQYFMDLWQLFQPKLSEPPIAVHHNKQALLTFWYQVCADCPENIKLIVQNAHVTKNIAFNYILADHEDQDVMIFNRYMLPAYYGLLRMCCQQSRPFTRQLAGHQNIQWAFKNVTPYSAQYPMAVDELYKLMRHFVVKYPDSTEQELKEIATFKCTSLQLYLSVLDGRSCWATLLAVLRILVENNDDRIFLVYNNAIPVLFEAFQTLHVMYHEATACHVTNDLTELLAIILEVLRCARSYREGKVVKQCLLNWKDRADTIRKLVTLLNSYASQGLRQACIDVLRELLLLYSMDCLQCLVPIMTHSHSACQENAVPVPCGPYFPRRGQKSVGPKSTVRPPHPVLQMTLHPNQLEVPRGMDPEYDLSVMDYFMPYHSLLDIMCRVAVNNDHLSEALVNLSVTVGIEGIPLHLPLFPKLWLDIYQAEHVDQKCVDMMCSSFFFVDYVERLLLTERICLANPIIFQFLYHYMPKIACRLTGDRVRNLVQSLLASLDNALSFSSLESEACRLNADLLALKLLCLVDSPSLQRTALANCLEKLALKCRKEQRTSDGAVAVTVPASRGQVTPASSVASTSSSSSNVCTTTEVASCSSSTSLVTVTSVTSDKDVATTAASTSGIGAIARSAFSYSVGEAVSVSGTDRTTKTTDDEVSSSKRQKLEETVSETQSAGTALSSDDQERPKSPRNPDRTEKSSTAEAEQQQPTCPNWIDILAKTAASLHATLRPPVPTQPSSSSNE